MKSGGKMVQAVRGRVVCVPGREEDGSDSTWHVVSADRSERHPLDGRTFEGPTGRADATAALRAFEG